MKKTTILFSIALFLCLALPFRVMAQWDPVDPERMNIIEPPTPLTDLETTLSGTVVSKSDDQPVVGASVIVVGTKLSTETDASGQFNLTVPSGKYTLRISHAEMKSVELAASSNMKIKLEPEPKTKPKPEPIIIKGTVVDQTDGQPIIGATVTVVGTSTGVVTDGYGRFSVPCPDGKNVLKITYIGMKSMIVTASPDMRVFMESKPPTSFYVQPYFQVGTLMGVGAAVGGYINHFNVEAFFTMGLSKSEDIYWGNTNSSSSVTCSYKPTAFGLRAGYGFTVVKDLRLTPQVGISLVNMKSDDGDSKANATSATIGVRGEYALTRNVALFAAPEVSFAVSKSDVCEQLMDISSKIKGWGTGFNARLGVSVTF